MRGQFELCGEYTLQGVAVNYRTGAGYGIGRDPLRVLRQAPHALQVIWAVASAFRVALANLAIMEALEAGGDHVAVHSFTRCTMPRPP